MKKKQKKYLIYEDYFLANDFVHCLKEDDGIIPKQLRLKKINNKFLKTIRYLVFIFNFPFKKYWFENPIVLDEIEDQSSNTIVIFDLGIYHTKFINQKFKKIQLKLWVWNKIDKGLPEKQFKYSKKNIKQIYTFDKTDSEKHDLVYLEQFFWRKQEVKNPKKETIFFVGVDKGRINQILNIKEKIPKYVATEFFIVPDQKQNYNIEQKELLIPTFMKYNQVLDYIEGSKYLLEINKENQDGLTVRALEALFFDTKLITNNPRIKEYDFYHPNNIFILTENINLEQWNAFFDSKYKEVPVNIKEKYFYKNWLENITGK